MLTKRETALLQKIGAEVEAREEEICRGGLTHDEYKHWTGFVNGLKVASSFVLEIDKQEDQ